MRENLPLRERAAAWLGHAAFNALAAAFALVAGAGCLTVTLAFVATVLCYALGSILLSAAVIAMAHEWQTQVPIDQLDPETILSCLSWGTGWNLFAAVSYFVADALLQRDESSVTEQLRTLADSSAPVRKHLAFMASFTLRALAPLGVHLFLAWVVPFAAGIAIALASAP